jgi:hypothetical protein
MTLEKQARVQSMQKINKGWALPFTLKSILRQKEELWKLKIFHHSKNIIFKESSKRNQNLSDIITL